MIDLVIAGGGPAGLATALHAARRGLHAVVFERQGDAPDKACGEGLMPEGLREIEALGVLAWLGQDERAPFHGIRYLQEGLVLEARFRGGSGLGIRRTALSRALRKAALAAGAELRRGTVTAVRSEGDRALLETSEGPLEARLAVAADGLHSPLRRAAGLAGPAQGPARFGLRRHFSLRPWADLVEVYWTAGAEAYVTPVGPATVNLAFLWERGAADSDFSALLARFPALRDRVGDAPSESETRGAGPLYQPVRAVASGRLALVGDAAGYVDAITGQGLSLAFTSAALLVGALPPGLAADLRPALLAYQSALRARFRRYALPARALLALSRKPRLRALALRAVARLPGAFPALVHAVG